MGINHFWIIIEGLKYIHKKKIIYIDIILDNILIDITNTIKENKIIKK